MDRRTEPESSPKPAVGDAQPPAAGWRFATFAFDLRRGELRDARGAIVPLRPKTELLLRRFLDEPGRLLSRDALVDAVWPHAVVTDDSLVQCVGDLRNALGDRDQRLIRTVPRRGYRFDAEVEPLDEVPATPDSPDAQAASNSPANASTAAPEPASPSAPVSGSLHRASVLRPRSRAALLSLSALAFAVLLAAFAWRWRSEPRVDIDAAITARHVFAVRPFQPAAEPSSDAPSDLRVAEQVADRIAAQIATWPGTRALGRAATAAFSGAPLERLGRELGAVYVVDGRLGPPGAPGSRASVEVQVSAVADGTLVGSHRFELGRDAEAGDELGQQVMSFLRGQVGAIDQTQALRPGHEPDAAELTLLGWSDIYRRLGRSDMEHARDRFERALAQDPDSIIALEGLGAVYMQERSAAGPMPSPDRVAASERAIVRAQQLAPNDATAAILWGNLQCLKGRPDLAIPAFEKSNRIVPAFVNGHLMLARALLSVGRFDEVPASAKRAAHLAELSSDSARLSAAFLVQAEAAAMRHDDATAVELARRAVAERPGSAQAHAVLGAAEALNGDLPRARDEIATSRRLSPRMTVANFDESRPSSEPRYVAARRRLYDALRDAGLPAR